MPSGRRARPKRRGGRGTGAVKATGSYEGSLPAEGTSDRHEPRAFTSPWSRRSWRLPHAERAAHDGSREPEGDRCKVGRRPSRLRARGRGDRGVRGMIAAGAVGTRRPRSCSRPPNSVRGSSRPHGNACPTVIRRSVLECRETLGTLVSRTEPETPLVARAATSQEGGIRAAKAAERAGNARSTGARRSFRWQKSVERIARLARREVARPRGGRDASPEEARSTA